MGLSTASVHKNVYYYSNQFFVFNFCECIHNLIIFFSELSSFGKRVFVAESSLLELHFVNLVRYFLNDIFTRIGLEKDNVFNGHENPHDFTPLYFFVGVIWRVSFWKLFPVFVCNEITLWMQGKMFNRVIITT